MGVDTFGLPGIDPANTQVFYGCPSTTWIPWNKPTGCSLIMMTVIGSGAGGGAGANANTGGGGGGGSGAIVRGIFPAILLPNTIFLQPGQGGASATDGTKSFISINMTQTTPVPADLILSSGNAAAAKGGNGTAAAGAAGAGGTIMTAANAILSAWSVWTAIAGVAGIIGGANVAGGNIVALASIPLTGGAAGGGGTAAGGNVTGAGLIPAISGGAGAAAGNATPGREGYFLPTPFLSTGGSGGGASGSTSGGIGGDGAFGSGGGGGGSNSGAGGAIAGGRGGDGLIILSWV